MAPVVRDEFFHDPPFWRKSSPEIISRAGSILPCHGCLNQIGSELNQSGYNKAPFAIKSHAIDHNKCCCHFFGCCDGVKESKLGD